MGFPVLPTIGEALGILTNPELRRVIRSADVVDLQWEDYAQLAPLIRALNPRARVICTLHDVVSQRFQRYLDTRTHARGRARWILATRTARIAEKLITCTADVVIVFSDKDRRLLGSARNVEVVHPALDSFTVIDRTHDLDHREIFFVGLMSRPENIDAVEWFIDRILPEIRRREPGAHFSILGGGTPAEIVQRHSPNDAVTFHGYVEDLSPWYGRAAVCVVPLRFGAGVKFKTVEALVAGVPTVTTSVGAEGIGTASYFSALTDDPVEFADAVARVLESPTTHSERAMASRAEVSRRYSLATFSARVMSIYLDGE